MEEILGQISKIVGGFVGDNVRHFVRYTKNIKELEEEKRNLEKKIKENKEKVDEANTWNYIVNEEVKEWALKAEEVKRDVENLMVDKARDENMKCLKFSRPNIFSRYRMSKKAVLKKSDLQECIKSGSFDDVAHRRPPHQFLSTGDFKNFDSRAELLDLIKDKLKSGVPMIGVHGVGGIGKTTAVEEVCKKLKEEGVFDEIVMGVVSRDVNVRQIQDQLAEQLSWHFTSELEMGRRGELWNRLNNGKKYLVILDDLWEKVPLKDIGIPERNESRCKVILTARDRRVLIDMGTEAGDCILVKALSENDAWVLFEKKVGVTFDSPGFRDVAKSVCGECGGLLVAILAVGGALAGTKDIRIWKAALKQQQSSSWTAIEGIDKMMYTSLRWSYDYLKVRSPGAKSILLLCCLYPEDDNIPVDFLLFHCIGRSLLGRLVYTMDDARNHVGSLVGTLKDCSLLLDGKNEDHVKMHDVIRDVVISIAEPEEHYLVRNFTSYLPVQSINENLAAISVCLKKLKELPNELVCPQLHTLRIELEDSYFQFPDNFFNGVGELKVLELKRIRMLTPPSSLANLSELRTLILIQCQLEDMSFLKGLKRNLEVLIIVGSDIKALPTDFGELSKLRVLLLFKCKRLELIPAGVISKLTHLEELCLPDEFTFPEEFCGSESEDIEISRAELSELSSLTRLTNLSVFIQNVTQVPALNFGNLVRYRIAVGEHFDTSEKYHFKERNLKLHGVTYHDKVVTLLERAEVLYLYKVNGLKNVLLNKEGKGFIDLEHFVIRDCKDLGWLLRTPNRYPGNQGPDSSKPFAKLTVLRISGCSFKFLFTSSCAKELLQLQELEIEDCGILEEIVGIEGEKDEQDDMVRFSKLKDLTLRNLPKLLSFGPKITEDATVDGDSLRKGQSLIKVIFPALEGLFISNLPNIIEIWDKQVLLAKSFPLLAVLRVSGCEKLVTVFPSKSWAQNSLRFVTVENCKGVKVVFSITGLDGSEDANNCPIIFSQLKYVRLCSLENLKTFCGNSTGSEPQSLFDPQVRFPALSSVTVKNCEKLVTVFPSKSWAQNSLSSVTVENCKGVIVVFSITGLDGSEDANNCPIIFSQLKYVRLCSLENLKTFCGNSTGSEPQSLFDPQVSFPALEDLDILNLPSVTEIWDKQVLPTESCPCLAGVVVRECDKLVTVFPSISWAHNSPSFVAVDNCKGVKVVFSITGLDGSEDANNCPIIFSRLEYVRLRDLENLKTFCGNSTGSEPQSLFDPQVIFSALEELRILNLTSITEIWDKQVLPTISCPCLARVEVRGCDKLVTVFPSNSWAQSSATHVTVGNSKGVKVVFSITGLDGSEDANNCPIIFSQLKYVRLCSLENLKTFCGNSTGSEPQSLFDPQVRFPALEGLILEHLPNEEFFKQQLSKGERDVGVWYPMRDGQWYKGFQSDGKPKPIKYPIERWYKDERMDISVGCVVQ